MAHKSGRFANDLAFVSQAWADDGVHVCLLADTGSGALIGTRTPGQPDRMVQTQLTSDYAVAACSLRTDTFILSASNRLAILGLSNGAVIRGPIESGPVEGPTIGAVVATADAAYFTLGGNGFDKGSVWKVSDLARVGSPVASFDASLQPIAFSGDDSLLVVSNGTSLQALEWRSGKVAWTYDQPADATGPVLHAHHRFIAPLLPTGRGLASHIGPSEATIRRGLWRKQGAVGTTHKLNPDRVLDEEVSTRLARPDLFVRGPVILRRLRASNVLCADGRR